MNVTVEICVLDEEGRVVLFHERATTAGKWAREKKGNESVSSPRNTSVGSQKPTKKNRKGNEVARYAVSFIVRRSFVRGDMAAPTEDSAGTGENQSPGLMKW